MESRHRFTAGFLWTTLTAVILCTLFCALTWAAPAATTVVWMGSGLITVIMGTWNAILGFVICSILYAVMHRQSGMVGSACDLIVVVLACMVVLSKQLLLVYAGVEWSEPDIAGWVWLHPENILLANFGAWVGIGVGAFMLRNGESIGDYLAW